MFIIRAAQFLTVAITLLTFTTEVQCSEPSPQTEIKAVLESLTILEQKLNADSSVIDIVRKLDEAIERADKFWLYFERSLVDFPEHKLIHSKALKREIPQDLRLRHPLYDNPKAFALEWLEWMRENGHQDVTQHDLENRELQAF